MKVILAKNAGFCMGVRRAVETTLDIVNREEGDVATFGPLIHNPQVLGLLRERGVRVLDEPPARGAGNIVIRAHGVPPEQKRRLEQSGARILDATCPHVVKVQVIIRKYRDQGYATVIIGDRNHAEVEGLMGFAGEMGRVVSSEEDARDLELRGPYIIVSQTTQDEAIFERLTRIILERHPGGKLFNTICDATHKRQEEVRELSARVGAVVVVGGRASANTQRLGEIATAMGRPVFLVETEAELDLAALSRFDRVGVTAGASTPTWMINRIVRTLEAIPVRDEGRLRAMFFKSIWLMLTTSLFVSLGGGLLTYVCALLQSMPPRLVHVVISFSYLYAMHNLNRFIDQRLKKFHDPLRDHFYRRNRWFVPSSSVLCLLLALSLTIGLGLKPFFLLLGMSILGVLYSVRLIPKWLAPMVRVRGLKEIPGSKTFFVAMAWALVTTLIPAWSNNGHAGPATLSTLVVVLLLVFARSNLFDVFEVQGDRLVGKETLPVCIGERMTLTFLTLLSGVLILLLVALPLLGLVDVTAFWLIPGVLYLLVVTRLYERGLVHQGPKLELALDMVFPIMAGLAGLGSLL